MARSLNELPPKQQWLVTGLICFALVAIYYMQFWRSYQNTIDGHRTQVVELRGEVQRMEAIARQLPRVQEETVLLERRLSILSNILPEEYESADLLRGLGALATQANLSLVNLQFEDAVPYEFYAESPIELELTGTYHDLARFFDRVGKFARIINIDEVVITAVESPDTPQTTVRAIVTAKTFIFLDEPEPTPEGQAQGAGR